MKMSACTRCRTVCPASALLTKQIRWRQSGPNGSVVKSRNLGKYCSGCYMQADKEFDNEATAHADAIQANRQG